MPRFLTKISKFFYLAFLICHVQAFAINFNSSDSPKETLPNLTAPVVDHGGFFSGNEVRDLIRICLQIRQNGGPQIAILTVPTLNGDVIENLSIKVAEQWKLGSAKEDDGLLIVLAKKERQSRIEVGNGIEGEIPDIYTAKFTKKIFPTYFRRGQFHQGIRIFLEDIIKRLKLPIQVSPSQIKGQFPETQRNQDFLQKKRHSKKAVEGLLLLMGALLIVGHILFSKKPLFRGIFTGLSFGALGFFKGLSLQAISFFFILGAILGILGIAQLLILALFHSSGRGGYHGGGGFGGGGFGGGGFGGGGGGFSGGGSSGDW